MVVISGPSGVGKDTVVRRVLEQRPGDLFFAVTATTRSPRVGEREGVDYYFVSLSEFMRLINSGELLEHAHVYNDYKGVPKQPIREALARGQDVIMRVDVQGADTIRRLLPQAVFVFLTVESEEVIVQRLRGRSTEGDDELRLRVATARQEQLRISDFDYCIVNEQEQVDKAAAEVLAIMTAERLRVHRKPICL